MANQIKHSNIIGLENRVFTKKTIYIKVEDETFEVVINQKLKETEIAEIVMELTERSKLAKDSNVDFNVMANIMILLIKKFTDIQFKKQTGDFVKDYEAEVKMLNALINLGILPQVMNEFEQEEVNKIAQGFVKHTEELKLIGNNITAKHFLDAIDSEKKESIENGLR